MSKIHVMAGITKKHNMADVKCRISLFLNILVVCLNIGVISVVSEGIQEYCSHEDFSPRCGSGEVVVMTHAVYGRMRLGKCIDTSMGYLGCKTDLLRTMDGLCSNKQQCKVGVHIDLSTNKNIDSSCPSQLLKYLEAEYRCEKVLQIDHTQCRSVTNKIEISTPISISSDALVQNHCGTSSMQLSARAGQKLNITLIDFNWSESYDSSPSCINYLELKDTALSQTTPVCAGTSRTRHIVTTDGSVVTTTFHIQDPTKQRFLLQIEAIGCGNISPPEGTWVRRDGDQTKLGCDSGKHTWTLRCEHNQWVGAVGSCGTGVIPSVEKTVSGESTEWHTAVSPGMIVFAICSMFLLVSSTVFTLAVCMYAKRSQPYSQKAASELLYPQQNARLAHHPQNQPMQWTMQPMSARPLPLHSTDDCGTQRDTAPATGKPVAVAYKHSDSENIGATPRDDEQIYCNTINSQTDSMYSDSVKYYVLENLNEQK